MIWSMNVTWVGNGSVKKSKSTWHVCVDKCDYWFIATTAICQRKYHVPKLVD